MSIHPFILPRVYLSVAGWPCQTFVPLVETQGFLTRNSAGAKFFRILDLSGLTSLFWENITTYHSAIAKELGSAKLTTNQGQEPPVMILS